MTASQTSSKLSQSLRRAKSQQADEDTAVIPIEETVSKPRTTATAGRRRNAAATNGSSFVMSSRCWPD